jgi:hypothetical protein
MKRTLQILNELERGGVIERYAIGDAMGATFLRRTAAYLRPGRVRDPAAEYRRLALTGPSL